MSNRHYPKALLITEGERREPDFFRRLAEVCHIGMTIVPVRGNIYALFQKMKKDNFQLNIKATLKEIRNVSEEEERLLQDNYAYTYLVFDFDAHHSGEEDRDHPKPIEEIIKRNLPDLSEMIRFFDNETDPTIGKLYINYPMMESYRDADTFTDQSFRERFVALSDISSYKRLTGQRKLANKRIDRLTEKEFYSLAKMNVDKLGAMNSYFPSLPYAYYRDFSSGDKILNVQEKMISEQKKVAVLNSSIFLLLDYFGNKKKDGEIGFYDSVVCS